MYSKSPRIMENEDIARKAKLYKKPEPSSYSPNFTLVENRTVGCFNLKCGRINHIDEAEYRGKVSPTWKDSKFSLVEGRVKQVNMIKPKEASPVKK